MSHKGKWTADDQEHYDYLRSRHIGVDKAHKMAKEMTAIDKRDKRRRKH